MHSAITCPMFQSPMATQYHGWELKPNSARCCACKSALCLCDPGRLRSGAAKTSIWEVEWEPLFASHY